MGKDPAGFDANAARAELRAIAAQLSAAGRRAHALEKILEAARSSRAHTRQGGAAASLRLVRDWSGVVDRVAAACAEQVHALRGQARRTASSSRARQPVKRSGKRPPLGSLNMELEMLGSLVAGLRNIALSVERGVAVQHVVHAERIRRLATSLESAAPGAPGPRSQRRNAAA